MRAGRDLQRDIGEALHELRARRRAARVDQREILFAADVGAELLVAVDEHDERVPRFDGARVQAGAEVAGDRDAVLAVGRERVRELHAAARAERHAGNVRALAAAGRREIRVRDFRLRLADGEVRDGARGVHVLLDERRRRAESAAAMFVKPWISISAGRYSSGSISTSSSAFTACAYSVRIRRCAAT